MARRVRAFSFGVPDMGQKHGKQPRNDRGLTEPEQKYVLARASGKLPAEAYLIGWPETTMADRIDTLKSAARNVECRPHVRAEFERLRDAATAKARTVVAEHLGIDRAWVMSNLKEVAERCLQHVPARDPRGKPITTTNEQGEEIGVYTFNAKGAVSALVPIGKELGMFADTKRPTDPLHAATDAELDAKLRQAADDIAKATGRSVAEVMAELGLTIEEQPSPHVAARATPPTHPPGGEAEQAPGDGTLH